MKVTIAVHGRFHAFDLARELGKRRCLSQIITSYLSSEARKYGIAHDKIDSLPSHEVLARAGNRLPRWLWRVIDVPLRTAARFDRLASERIREADLFVGWSGASLISLKRARTLGMKTVLERGSCHMQAQQELLAEEKSRLRLAKPTWCSGLVERELEEYEVADRIMVPSSFAYATFAEKGVPSNKLLKVPYGVNVEEFSPKPKGDRKFRIIYTGALNARKGVHYLIDAFRELRLPRAELWMVGGVTEETGALLEKRAHPDVYYLGHRPQRELPWFYSQADVFCLPSIEDGFGMVILQAMACGLPAICTTNTGGPDVVEEGVDGAIVPIRSKEALAEKIEWLYRNRDLARQMGEAASKKVRANYTWDKYCARVLDEYAR